MKTASGAFTGAPSAGEAARANFSCLLDARNPIAPRIGSILTPVEFSRAGDDLVRNAVSVANLFGARLIGLTHSAASGSSREGAEVEAAQVLARAATARFEILSRPVNAPCRCVEGEGSLSASLEHWAWSADLVMLARRRSEPWLSWEADPLDVIRRTRLPILITAAGKDCSVLHHVVVVWSGTAASSAALRAALPFLGRATTVTLLVSPWRRDLPARENALDAVRRGLLSRNIQPAVVRLDPCLSGSRIADHVADLAPDLVVAAEPRPGRFRGPRLGASDLDRLGANTLVVG